MATLGANILTQLLGSNLIIIFINILIILIILAFLLVVVFEVINFIQQFSKKVVYLELTPLAFTDKIPQATEQFFSALHGMKSNLSFVDRLFRRKIVLSMEVVSSKDKGIRFIVCIPANMADVFKRDVHAYLPDTKIKVIKEYLNTSDPDNSKLMEFKLSRHFAYPLSSSSSLYQHDPVAYLTNSMTKLEDGELMVFQIVLSPERPRSASRLRNRLISGKDTRVNSSKNNILTWMISSILKIFVDILNSLLEFIGELFSGDYHMPESKIKVYPQQPITAAAQELLNNINTKLSQSLYRAHLRVLVVSEDKKRLASRSKEFKSAFATFDKPGLQSIVPKTGVPYFKKKQFKFNQFSHRTLSLNPIADSLLSVSELAALYHFPHSLSARTENVVKSLSRTLPAPVALKNGSKVDVVLGSNHHQGSDTPIGLTADERQRHVYILGGTGNGKTTMLMYSVIQDINNDKGVAVIDPHGDLAETIIKHVPEDRIKDVIYFNPADISYPIGLNVLEVPKGLKGDQLLIERDFITESVVSLFRKIFSEDDSGGHRIEYILRNAIHTAYTVDNPTLFTVYDLLNDVSYRRKVVSQLEDKDLKNFWKNEYGQAGGMQRVKMSAGITSKLGRFLRSASSRRVLEQVHSTIDFDDILASKKILICNFSKGQIGEDTSTLFGVSVLSKIQLAAYRRQRLNQSERQPFYLYVDEFQNFATASFIQLLSEARKYKLFITIAEQSPSQQDKLKMVSTILANVGTVVCFRSGSPMDEKLMFPLFEPYINKGELLNLPAYNFYMRIAAVEPYEPLSGTTILLENERSEDTANEVIEESRKHYASAFSDSNNIIKTSQKYNKSMEMDNSKQYIGMKKAIKTDMNS